MKLFQRKPDFQIPGTGISETLKLRIGGIDQWILVQGERLGLPVLLFLHGGPSMPLPGVSSRGVDCTIATTTNTFPRRP